MDEDFPPPPFAGFPEEGFAFLEHLTRNQDRDWVASNKAIYETALRQPLSALVADLSGRFAEAGLPLRGDPKRAVFRLNRDVRFSKDKRPYKTHASAVMTSSGEKGAPGVFYVHVDPAGSFAAAGFFHPEPDVLHRLRRGIVDDEEGWDEMKAALDAADLPFAGDDALVRLPKGFGPAAPAIEAALKLKSWHVKRDLPHALMGQARLAEKLAAFAVEAAPLLRFGWSALDRHPAAAGAGQMARRR